jgi:hypothetical protein
VRTTAGEGTGEGAAKTICIMLLTAAIRTILEGDVRILGNLRINFLCAVDIWICHLCRVSLQENLKKERICRCRENQGEKSVGKAG